MLDEYGDRVVVARIDPGSEHPDNARFAAECETWFGVPITLLASDRYKDTWDVFERTGYLVGPGGARCTTELKKRVRYGFEHPHDIQVFGYTSDEQDRADRFREQNPGVTLLTPLIDRGISKDDCLALIARQGIEVPAMYLLGYQNNNCIGCVKGGMGYWNKIRVDFPEVFERMAQLERTMNRTVLRDKIPNGTYTVAVTDEDGNDTGETVTKTRYKSVPLFLDELDPSRGNPLTEPSFECGLVCATTEESFT